MTRAQSKTDRHRRKAALAIRNDVSDPLADKVPHLTRDLCETYASTTHEWELDDYVAPAFALDKKTGKQLREPHSYFFLASADKQLVGNVLLRIVAAPACVIGQPRSSCRGCIWSKRR